MKAHGNVKNFKGFAAVEQTVDDLGSYQGARHLSDFDWTGNPHHDEPGNGASRDRGSADTIGRPANAGTSDGSPDRNWREPETQAGDNVTQLSNGDDVDDGLHVEHPPGDGEVDTGVMQLTGGGEFGGEVGGHVTHTSGESEAEGEVGGHVTHTSGESEVEGGDTQLGPTSTASTTFTATSDGDVSFHYVGANAAHWNSLVVKVGGVVHQTGLSNNASAPEASFSLGFVKAGTPIEFILNVDAGHDGVTDHSLSSDEKSNPGLVSYATSEAFSGGSLNGVTLPQGVFIGFEDIIGGGDLDFNDFQFLATNVSPASVPAPNDGEVVGGGGGVVQPPDGGEVGGEPGPAEPTGGSGTAGHDHLVGTSNADQMSGLGDADTVAGKAGNDQLWGGVGDDKVWGGSGNDEIHGGDGNDILVGGFGSDKVYGGAGNDTIFNRSDAGEPEIANVTGVGVSDLTKNTTKLYPNEPFLDANDVMVGGEGADTFRTEFLINGRDELLQMLSNGNVNGGISSQPVGVIDWMKIHDYSTYLHHHYVESIGSDVIRDFNKAEGDKLEFAGHTLAFGDSAYDVNWTGGTIHYGTDEGGAYSQFSFVAMQGGGGHAGDMLGSMKVYGDKVMKEDINIDRTVHYGAYEKFGDGPHLWEDDGILPYGGSTGGHHLTDV